MRRECLIRQWWALFALLAIFVSPVLGQRTDRIIITGVVNDPEGAYVPGAQITITNEETGVVTSLQTNQAGAYNSPQLVLGNYSVRVEHPGFQAFVRRGINPPGGTVYRLDAILQLGEVTQTIEVSAAAEMTNVEQSDVSHTVSEKYYDDLPVVMGADIRLAESLLQMQPGYLPMKPNGDPMFRGSAFNSRLNGGQTMGVENFFDGAAFGFAEGHQQTHESSPPIEAVQEMRVITNMYDAQYGHSTGGVIEYTGKSGTNELHGSVYEFFANEDLNARGFFGEKAKNRNNNYGFKVGGPVVIPGVYDGRNKTFGFVNLDILDFRSGVLPAFGNTVPIEPFRQGDFSQILNQQNQLGTDVQGRPIYQGQIFDPSTTAIVNGTPVRDPFPNNMIPANHPLRSSVAQKVTDLIPGPDRPGQAFNVQGNPAGDQTWVLDAHTVFFRVDHLFTDNFRTSHTFWTNPRPSIRNCGGVQGCNADNPGDPASNTDFIGEGFFQRISTQHAHQQFDWIISNNLLNHTTIAYDRWFMGGNSLSAGADWPQRLFGENLGGLIETDAGPPQFNFSGNIPFSTVGQPWTNFGFNTNNRWQFSDDLTWVKGRHSFSFGGEFRHHQFPFAGWGKSTGGIFSFNRRGTAGFDADGNNLALTGDPFASFLLGQVDSANFTIPAFPVFEEQYWALYVNDKYKATDRLTLTFGLRFDKQQNRQERYDNMSTFRADVPNPGAGGIPGALIFAGEGPGRSGLTEFEDIPNDAWGPRFGFGYRLNEKTVLRGGYGIYYSHIPFSQFGAQPNFGFEANPLSTTLDNGLTPAFFLDNGIPQDVVRMPPFIDPAFSNGTSPVAVAEDGLDLPRTQNWNFTIQRQLNENMMFEASYIGVKGNRLIHNAATLGVAANRNDPAVRELGSSLLQADINSPEAAQAGIAPPYPGFRGGVVQALRPFPQFQNIGFRNVPTGNSIYHALQTKLEKRFSSGLQFRASYTWSKFINDGAESAQAGNTFGTGPQNPLNTLAAERALSADDVPHSFLFSWTYELPTLQGRNPFIKHLFGGWGFSGIFRIESARPLNIVMANDLGSVLFNSQKRPNVVPGVDPTPLSEDEFEPGMSFFNPAAFEDPGNLQFGNAARRLNDVRGFTNWVEDFNFYKNIPLSERFNMKFEAQFGNIFNRVVFCDPDTNFSSPTFGQVFAQCNSPRSVQFGLRVDF